MKRQSYATLQNAFRSLYTEFRSCVESLPMNTDALDSIPDERFSSLMRLLRDGHEDASNQIVDEYGDHILRAVRRRMNQRMRERFDSQDFAQAVWASFFGNLSIVGKFDNSGQLAGFLARVASNKVIDAGRRTKVRSEQNSRVTEESVDLSTDHRRRYSEPTPSQHAVARERWDHLNDDENDMQRKLLELRRSGATQSEIAEALGMSERHIRRILSRLSRKTDDHA